MRNSPLVHLTGGAAPLLRANIDTDAIAPSRVKMHVDATDLANTLFNEWRFAPDGSERPDFILNQRGRRDSQFLIALDNFGCGSSRETAVWALRDFGFRCIVAPSFGSIFRSNCYRNGVAPIVLDRTMVERLGGSAEADASLALTLDLSEQRLSASDGFAAHFEIEPGPKRMLLEGLDSISLTLRLIEEIKAFRQADRARRSWIYAIGRDGFEDQVCPTVLSSVDGPCAARGKLS